MLAWLTSLTGDRYNLDLLTYAEVRREPTTGTWLLRVAAQDGGLPVTMVADPRESVVLAGLGTLLVRGWVPVAPDEYAASGAAVNPRALAVVDYRRKPHDWMDGWAEQTAEQRAGHQLGDPERAEEWEVILHTTNGAGQRLAWPYPARPGRGRRPVKAARHGARRTGRGPPGHRLHHRTPGARPAVVGPRLLRSSVDHPRARVAALALRSPTTAAGPGPRP